VPATSINAECGKRTKRFSNWHEVGSKGHRYDDPVAWPQVHAINYGHFQVHTDTTAVGVIKRMDGKWLAK